MMTIIVQRQVYQISTLYTVTSPVFDVAYISAELGEGEHQVILDYPGGL